MCKGPNVQEANVHFEKKKKEDGEWERLYTPPPDLFSLDPSCKPKRNVQKRFKHLPISSQLQKEMFYTFMYIYVLLAW